MSHFSPSLSFDEEVEELELSRGGKSLPKELASGTGTAENSERNAFAAVWAALPKSSSILVRRPSLGAEDVRVVSEEEERDNDEVEDDAATSAITARVLSSKTDPSCLRNVSTSLRTESLVEELAVVVVVVETLSMPLDDLAPVFDVFEEEEDVLAGEGAAAAWNFSQIREASQAASAAVRRPWDDLSTRLNASSRCFSTSRGGTTMGSSRTVVVTTGRVGGRGAGCSDELDRDDVDGVEVSVLRLSRSSARVRYLREHKTYLFSHLLL